MLDRFIARLVMSLAIAGIAIAASVAGFAYFSYALYLFLLSFVVPAAAALLTGILILVFAFLAIAILRGISPKRRKRPFNPSMDATEAAAEIGSLLGGKLRGRSGASKNSGLIAALVGGFLIGVSPRLRAFLLSLLKL